MKILYMKILYMKILHIVIDTLLVLRSKSKEVYSLFIFRVYYTAYNESLKIFGGILI